MNLAYWAGPAEVVAKALGADLEGLTTAEVAKRYAALGPNRITDASASSVARILLRQVTSPLVLILIVGALLSLFLRGWIDAAIIVAGSALLGFGQEYRASRAIAQLKARLALTARVIRDGAAVPVPFERLVPGDIVELAAGNLVPADGMILSSNDLLASESALTEDQQLPFRHSGNRDRGQCGRSRAYRRR